LIARL
jgi:hypothetical protein